MAIKLDQVGTLVRNVYFFNARSFQDNFTALMMGNFAADTPIDQGLAKGNWNAMANVLNVRASDEQDRSKTGLRARRKAFRQISGNRAAKRNFKVGRVANPFNRKTYVVNAVNSALDPRTGGFTKQAEGGELVEITNTVGEGYIIQLENGKSNQAPNGMFYINLAAAEFVAKKAKKL